MRLLSIFHHFHFSMWPCMIPKGTANTVWRLAGIDLAARKGVCAKTRTHTSPFASTRDASKSEEL